MESAEDLFSVPIFFSVYILNDTFFTFSNFPQYYPVMKNTMENAETTLFQLSINDQLSSNEKDLLRFVWYDGLFYFSTQGRYESFNTAEKPIRADPGQIFDLDNKKSDLCVGSLMVEVKSRKDIDENAMVG